MGQSQSNPAAPAASAVKKKSYYELLEVERTATDEELKKAYRSKALSLHPDRNFGNEEAATSLFAEIQAAYEVLSDPQDRAWYDTYELASVEASSVQSNGFKRTSAAARRGRDQPDILDAGDLNSFFGEYHGIKRSSLRSDKKFWQGVQALFDRLAREEVNAAIIAGDRDTDASRYPSFGSPLSESDYTTSAKGFYAAWNGFSTRKTFAWLDKWDDDDGEDRRMRRAIEKENKRGRETHIREYNTAVRMLVAFIKKGDPRVEDKTTPSPQEMEKLAREKVDEQKKRAREANEARLKQAMENQTAAQILHTPLAEDEEFYSDEDEEKEDEDDGFECVACEKKFKSAKQYEAHERSKKHKKAIWELRKFMEKEDAELHLGGRERRSKVDTDETEEENEANETEYHAGHDTALPAKEVSEMKIADEKSSSLASEDSHSAMDESNDHHSDTDNNGDDDEFIHPDLLKDKSAPSSTLDPPKLGKAAQKRAKKAAAVAAVSQRTGLSSQDEGSVSAFKCVTCNAGFPTKSKLFDHIKLLPKHAAPAVQVYGSGTDGMTGSKKKKGKR